MRRAPDAARIERLRVVADERCGIEGGAMILTTERVAIEQPQPALLARADQELGAAVIEHNWRGVDVEVPPP